METSTESAAIHRGKTLWRSRLPAAVLALALVASWQLFLNGRPAQAVTGDIGSASIEIDSSANLYPGDSAKNCSTASFAGVADWVTDCAANTDSATLVQSIATGLIPGVTSKVGGTGHWAGVRIVDGIAGDDQDIFLTGGKENDTSTWNVGPGTVGSSKYDATQAYLANNQQFLFFGMERRGNNGTTAFDFEFSQNAPPAGENYIPTRTNGDVLWTFEMQGAGNSGSAVPHYFVWSASLSKYVEQTTLPAGTEATINTNRTTPSAPWGRVDTHGNWVGDAFDRFAFAEAKVPLSVLPGVSACGGRAYVQVRTRSSSTENSDLKDTTKIFEFVFGTPTASASKQSANGATGVVTLTSSQSGISGTPLWQWQRLTVIAPATTPTWNNIAGATSSTLNYSSFEADDPTTDATGAFTLTGIASGNYVGKVHIVQLRVQASDGTTGCLATSPAVTVKKVIAVDP